MIHHTIHSLQRCKEYGISQTAVFKAINGLENEIQKCGNVFEVKVVLQRFNRTVSNKFGRGEYLIAAIDPNRLKIKTVMLRRQSQLDNEVYPIIEVRR